MNQNQTDILSSLKSYKDIVDEWKQSGASQELARLLTLRQVISFEKIVNDDECFKVLLEKFRNGRETDSWLATDWDTGFDELILCAPLCNHVDWRCSECMIGKRQANHSCEDENSLFGLTAELLKQDRKDKLMQHISDMKQMLEDSNVHWDLERHAIINEQ